MEKNTPNQWQFQRLGNANQVLLQTGQNIRNLKTLDPKLWMALSCPATGLEFDKKTLQWLDKNDDQQIRIAEVLSTIDWLSARLNHLSPLIDSPERVDLDNINTEAEAGQKIKATAQAILSNLNLEDRTFITLEDIQHSNKINASQLYNGDGIFQPAAAFSEPLQSWITTIMALSGSLKDASGEAGIDLPLAKATVDYVQAAQNWTHSFDALTTQFGDKTADVCALVETIKPKIEDYFLRTDLASYAPQTEISLNVDPKYIVPTDNGLLGDAQLADLPISKIVADQPLNLKQGINPIWQDQLKQLAQLCAPLLEDKDQLTQAEWIAIQTQLAPYEKLKAEKPVFPILTVAHAPTSSADKLSANQIALLLNPELMTEFKAKVKQDLSTPISTASLLEIEQLASYHRYFYRFLCNFVSLTDFFNLKDNAIFQSGKLYLDGRCCTLCSEVTDIGKHATLATYSSLYLIYCQCTRKEQTGDPKIDNKTIVAAMTAGDCLYLVEGRNGIYIDNLGADWDAKIVKIIDNPISIQQAVLDPYRKFGKFVSDQINKWASNKESAIADFATKQATAENVASGGSSKFDIAKTAGIFAAIGLALGALGTALASIFSSLLALSWWQIPLVFLAIFIIISGPSVILAWLKLRKRSLAPLLEASGWAINSNMKINLYLGRQLTSQATLPKNASLNLTDPTKKKSSAKSWIFFLILCILIGAGGYLYHKHYGWNNPFEQKVEETVIAEPTNAETPAQPEAAKIETPAETAPAS